MVEEMESTVREMESSLNALEAQVRSQVARTQAGTRAVLVVGIIVIAVIFGYMAWLTSLVKEQLVPSKLVQDMEIFVKEKKTDALAKLEQKLKDEAPKQVALLRTRLETMIPVMREKAEASMRQGVDVLFEKLEEKVDGVVAEVLAMHKQELTPLIEAAVAEGNETALKDAFEESMQLLIKPKLDEVLLKFDRTMMIVELELNRLKRPIQELTMEQMWIKEAVVTMLVFINDAVAEGMMQKEGVTDIESKLGLPST